MSRCRASVATEACRRARQRPRFRRARAATRPGSCSTSSPPQEEARLAVLGCHKLLEPGDGPALIFDIGGGSTELVLVDQVDGVPRIRSWWSAPWGVVSLTESEGRDGDRGQGPRRRLRAHARARAAHSFTRFADTLPKTRQGHPPARHQRHRHDARQRPSRAAAATTAARSTGCTSRPRRCGRSAR